jgi:sugar O-acyltransferase (sialic acid O-acetyltransferase NeuD family)
MKNIVIIGAGGFGREVHKLIDEINKKNKKWNLIGYIDDGIEVSSKVNGLPLLGGVSCISQITDIHCAVIAIAKPLIIYKISEFLNSIKIETPNLIHPSYEIEEEFVNLGVGNIICHGFYMTRNINIGNFNIFNSRVTLGHDVTIGSYNVFMPNVQISGECSIKDLNLFGMNCSTLQKLTIGSGNSLGAHSFLIKSIADEQNLFGIPAKKISI